MVNHNAILFVKSQLTWNLSTSAIWIGNHSAKATQKQGKEKEEKREKRRKGNRVSRFLGPYFYRNSQ
jgi:hypothetical protein